MTEARPRLILDVGGGKSCSLPRCGVPRVIALDISEEEIRENFHVDDRVVGDVVKGFLPGFDR
jgi:hypothetical protein